MAKPPPLPTPDLRAPIRLVIGIVIGIVIVAALFSMVYMVPQGSQTVILRFGKINRTVSSTGIHFKLPLGIEEHFTVRTERQNKVEFGFGTDGASNKYQFSKDMGERANEQNMVTGDLNAALVQWVVQYRIDEPAKYLFNVHEPELTLRDAAESVMREVVGDRTVDEVITVGRADIETENLVKLQDLVSSYEMGIRIMQIQLKDVDPPKAVQASFNDVNNAQQERERKINEARREYDAAVPRAKGDAEKMVSEAEAYESQRINEAEGDAARFTSIYEAYQKAPEVTKRRIYLETISDVIPSIGKKVIVDEEASQVLPLLNLNQGTNQ